MKNQINHGEWRILIYGQHAPNIPDPAGKGYTYAEIDSENSEDSKIVCVKSSRSERIFVERALRLAGILAEHKSGTPPDTSLHLGDKRRAWLQEQGGIQPTITRLIDDAMKSS